MTSQQLLLGVDSGGSKTRVVLADEHGDPLGTGLAGCSNYQYAGEAAAVAEIEIGIDAAFAQAGLARRTVDFACFGIGGADTPEDTAKARQWVADNHWAAHCLAVNDGMLPLYAACPDGQGVSVIAGTGAIMWAQTLDGRIARASGWGYLLGDEGGGWQLGHEALRHVARAADGRGPATLLTERVLAFWGLHSPFDLINRLYQADVTPGDIASLAKVVVDCAAAGDAIALQIARAGADELALAAKTVMDALSLRLPLTLAYSGSLLIKGLFYRELFAQSCRRMIGNIVLAPIEDPVMGAVAAARLLMARDR
ncbi:MAG: BadF/BadG/BcrA/BcrD type ATPase [Chloroflexi bacterium]|nr:BadF/BadG/BcrA/BcrD type ATPase [Chloroflexota bacterium]MCL5274617.1 BadF/BadG/BcrA/BcrD type ATPase [Chloroflexota bacterium]